MIVAKTIDAAREKALLKEWFDTVQWDEESEGIPPLEDEVDDEGRHANHNQLTHGGGTGLAQSSVEISNRKADDLASRVKTPDGGFTVDPRTGKDIKEGYAVAIYPDRSREVPATAVNRKVIQDYATSNQDLLSQQGNMMGGWHDPDSGNVWLDISRVTGDRMEAIDLAKQHNQIAMFDLGTGNSVNTGGTGRSSYPFVFGQESNRHLPGKHSQKTHGSGGTGQSLVWTKKKVGNSSVWESGQHKITNLGNSAMDDRTVEKEVLPTVASLHRTNPVSGPIDIRIVRKIVNPGTPGTETGTANGIAVVGKGQIKISGYRLTAGDKGIDNDGFLAPARVGKSTIKSTLVHEWGHSIDKRGNNVTKTIPTVSKYGKSDPYEAYAENFAEFYLSGGKTNQKAAIDAAKEFGWKA